VTGETSELLHESTLGKSYVGLGGVIAITLYLVVTALLLFYLLIKLWPPEPLPAVVTTTAGMPSAGPASFPNPPSIPEVKSPANPSESSTKSTTPAENPSVPAAQTVIRETGPITWPLYFFWSPRTAAVVSLNASLFLIAIFSGALGSLLHSLRSLYWYAGNRKLVWSWAIMYMLLPFSGAVLSIVFYMVIRAGFLPSSGTQGPPNTPYGFAALGALVGLFSEEAVLKLKQVAETVFAKSETGKDHAAPLRPPRITSVAPKAGPAGTEITITGSDFGTGAKVNIGGTTATDVTSASAMSITATTPPHASGQVDVEVINPDGQKSALAGGYQYT